MNEEINCAYIALKYLSSVVCRCVDRKVYSGLQVIFFMCRSFVLQSQGSGIQYKMHCKKIAVDFVAFDCQPACQEKYCEMLTKQHIN